MSAGLAVSDTSPLIVLDRIGHLVLLERLFNTIVVPPAVVSELGSDFQLPNWISLSTPKSVRDFAPRLLGKGEMEAINLALEIRAEHIILDDNTARYWMTTRPGVSL